jgi:hypothetical protein
MKTDQWADYRGPEVTVTTTSGATSGRYAVARVIARVFPTHMAFVEDVIGEGVEPASNFPVGPYSTDKAISQTARMYEYQTPPNSEGIGGNNKSEYPWDGVVILQGQAPDVLSITVRLPNESSNLASDIIKQAERDSYNNTNIEEGPAQVNRASPKSAKKKPSLDSCVAAKLGIDEQSAAKLEEAGREYYRLSKTFGPDAAESMGKIDKATYTRLGYLNVQCLMEP